MTSPKVPNPGDILSAAQAAVDTAQAVAAGAMRLPPASAQLAAQLPDLVENLAAATERLNTTLDRAERLMALGDPMFRTLDLLLPRLEAMVDMGTDLFRTLSAIPGVWSLSRFAGINSTDPAGPAAGGPAPGTSSTRRRAR